MFYITTNEYGQLMQGYNDIAGREPLLEPREVELDITSNPDFAELSEAFVPSFILDELPLLAARPTMLRLNGYSKSRLFAVEPIGEYKTLGKQGNYIAADKIRVVAELSPALLFGSHNLHQRINTLHTLSYGVPDSDNMFAISSEKLKEFKNKFVKAMDTFFGEALKDLDEDDKYPVMLQLLVHKAYNPKIHPDLNTIISNSTSVVDIDLFPIALVLAFESILNMNNEAKDIPMVYQMGEICEAISEITYDVFGTSF